MIDFCYLEWQKQENTLNVFLFTCKFINFQILHSNWVRLNLFTSCFIMVGLHGKVIVIVASQIFSMLSQLTFIHNKVSFNIECFKNFLSFSPILFTISGALLRVCPWEHQAVVLQAISLISMKLCQFKGSTPKLKKTNWFLFWFFPGGDRPPPGFSWFSPRKSLQIGKMYEALTAMVFNRLLWGFAHIFLHP